MAASIPLVKSSGSQRPNNRAGGNTADLFVRIGSAVLVAGTKVVADTKIGADDLVIAFPGKLGTVSAAKLISVTRTAGTSITFTSTDNTDTSTITYLIIPAAAVA